MKVYKFKPVYHGSKDTLRYKSGTWKIDCDRFLETIESRHTSLLLGATATTTLQIIIAEYYNTNSFILKTIYINKAWEVYCKADSIHSWNTNNNLITYEITEEK